MLNIWSCALQTVHTPFSSTTHPPTHLCAGHLQAHMAAGPHHPRQLRVAPPGARGSRRQALGGITSGSRLQLQLLQAGAHTHYHLLLLLLPWLLPLLVLLVLLALLVVVL